MSLQSLLTEATCAEPCWNAREEICRCSCGGKNHGCLRVAGAARPTRNAKIDGFRYELLAVGNYGELYDQAKHINSPEVAGYKSLDAMMISGSAGKREVVLYYYTFKETERFAPARLNYATNDQLSRWVELSAYRGLPRYQQRNIALLWKRQDFVSHEGERLIIGITLAMEGADLSTYTANREGEDRKKVAMEAAKLLNNNMSWRIVKAYQRWES